MTPYPVTFLFDPRNNWLLPFVRDSGIATDNAKYAFSIIEDPADWQPSELTFILGYTRILPAENLARSKLNLVVHESDLPRGRGFAPVQWQILEGKNIIPVCLIEASHPVDTGDIFARDCITLTGTELFPEIRAQQARATLRLIGRFLDAYPQVTRTPQQGEPTIFRRRGKKDSELDVNRTLAEQFNLLRIADNDGWPAFFTIDGKKYVLRIHSEND